MDRWINGWMDRGINGWMDGLMDGKEEQEPKQYLSLKTWK